MFLFLLSNNNTSLHTYNARETNCLYWKLFRNVFWLKFSTNKKVLRELGELKIHNNFYLPLIYRNHLNSTTFIEKSKVMTYCFHISIVKEFVLDLRKFIDIYASISRHWRERICSTTFLFGHCNFDQLCISVFVHLFLN